MKDRCVLHKPQTLPPQIQSRLEAATGVSLYRGKVQLQNSDPDLQHGLAFSFPKAEWDLGLSDGLGLSLATLGVDCGFRWEVDELRSHQAGLC